MQRLLVLCAFCLGAAELSAQEVVEKTKPRPVLSDEEYRQQVVELRKVYSQPSNQWPKPNIDEGVRFVELGLLPQIEYPKANPHSKEKEKLGMQLFFDPRLSGSKQIACASCHDPDLAWGDGRSVSFGHGRKILKRNAPSLLNIGLNKKFFWDGRAESLEAQAKAVLLNPDEMNSSEAEIVRTLSHIPDYVNAFKVVFSTEEITIDRVTQAIATFERSLKGGRSRFDHFLKGKPDLLNDREIRGLHLFRTDARCVNCHHGPTFTDGELHNLGLSYYGRKFEDLGRYDVSKKNDDVGKFKTPSLRNVGRTGPYMHNGLFEIEGILNMYNAGMPTLRPKQDQLNDPRFPKKSPLLKPLNLNKQDLADLQAFLLTLDEPKRVIRPPELPSSK